MSENGTHDSDYWWSNRVFRSVTLYPWATMDAKAEMRQLAEQGVNTVFVVTKESDGRVFYNSEIAPPQIPNRDILADLADAAAIHGIKLIPSLFLLCDKYLVETYPETVQIAREGTEIRHPNVSMEWMYWACPNHDVIRDHLRSIIEELLRYDIDGIQFTHFEFQPIRNGESSYRSCFCDECVRQYEMENVTSDSDEWTSVRAETITSLLAELTDPVRSRDDLLTNIELEAFADRDSAIADSREMIGVDPRAVAEFAEVLTPRTAHVDLDMHPLWIRDTVRSLHTETKTPVVPSIRTSSSTNPQDGIPADELITAMQMALHGGASGVSLFSTGANIGRISPNQWGIVEQMFDEMARFEREYGTPRE